MSRASRAAGVVFVLCTAAAAHGQGETPLLGGKAARLTDKAGTASDSAKVRFARDPALAFPPSPLCPTSTTLELSSPEEQPGPIALPCAGWSAKGAGFVYADKLGSAGGVRKVVLKAGKLSISAKGGTYRAIMGPVSALDVRLDVGGQRYCGRFVTMAKNLQGNVRAKGPTVPCGGGLPGIGDLVIDAPADGTFVGASVVRVTGRVFNIPPGAAATVRLKDVLGDAPATIDPPTGRWAGDVVVDAGRIVNPVLAELTVDGQRRARRRITLIVGASLPEGTPAPHGIGIAAGAALFPDHLDGTLTALAGPLLNQLWDHLEATDPIPDIDFRSVSHSGHSVRVRPGLQQTDVVLEVARLTGDMRVRVNNLPDCNAQVTVTGLRLELSFAQSPDTNLPSRIDLSVSSGPRVQFAHLDAEAGGGLGSCELFVEGKLHERFSEELAPLVSVKLGDPDGPGPQDSPIADALEATLAELDVSGPIGAAIGVDLDARFADVVETAAVVVYDVDASVTAAQPDPDAPKLVASYHQPSVLPAIGSATPSGQQPYDLGLLLSTSLLNQLTKAGVESGLLNLTATAIGSQALTPGFLRQLVPAFGSLEPQDRPLELRIRPTVAPIVTAGGAPPAAPAVVRLSNLLLDVVDAADRTTYLAVALDARLEVFLDIQTGQLLPRVATPAPGDVTAVVLGGTLAVSDAEIGSLAPTLVGAALPGLVGALGPVDLPSLAGLPPFYPVEVTSVGGYLAAFLDFNDPPWFVAPPTDGFVTIPPGGSYELQVVAQDGESAPVLTVDVSGPSSASWGLIPDPPTPGTASGTFLFFGDVEGLYGVTFTVTDANGLMAVRFLTISVCEDPIAIICPL